MRKLPLLLATAAFAAAVQPAHAQEGQGRLQVKLLATGVLPDGKIDKVRTDLIGLPAGTQTSANDNVVPTLAIEYFVSPAVSVETICCMTQHDVDGTAGLPGAELVSNAKLVPATVTVKYHFNPGGVSPYVGAGPAYFLFFKEKPGAATRTLGTTRFDMSNELGFALQAGVDIPVNDSGLAVSLDAKRYFIDTNARWFAGTTKVLETRHQLDPWVISAGVALRF